MAIKRFFEDKYYDRIKADFKFLIRIINNSNGEFDLSIRENYFNIYYKGYNIGKISPAYKKLYKVPIAYSVSINKKFFIGTEADNSNHFATKFSSGDYWNILLKPDQLHPFLQKKHLSQFASRVNKIPAGELAFEQAIMTDNLNRTDIIIIDRQITDTELKRRRVDLLALKQKDGINYHFQLLEVKLGKNAELKGQVKSQLESYINHIDNNFDEYKASYEKQFAQKVNLGLIDKPNRINIEKPVMGQILVGSYSGIADTSIAKLRAAYPNLDIKHFKYAL